MSVCSHRLRLRWTQWTVWLDMGNGHGWWVRGINKRNIIFHLNISCRTTQIVCPLDVESHQCHDTMRSRLPSCHCLPVRIEWIDDRTIVQSSLLGIVDVHRCSNRWQRLSTPNPLVHARLCPFLPTYYDWSCRRVTHQNFYSLSLSLRLRFSSASHRWTILFIFYWL